MPATGAILILANGLLDMLDGCVARARGTAGPFGSFLDKIIDKYADLIFLLGMLLGGLAHPVAVIVSMVGIPLATYINAAVESLTKGEVKFQEKTVPAVPADHPAGARRPVPPDPPRGLARGRHGRLCGRLTNGL